MKFEIHSHAVDQDEPASGQDDKSIGEISNLNVFVCVSVCMGIVYMCLKIERVKRSKENQFSS